MFDNVADAAFVVQVIIAFGAGVISFVSPCVLPLLPGYLSMMSGYSSARLESGEVSTGHMTRVILLFILGFTVVFTAIGAVATGLSSFLVGNLDSFTRVAGVVIIAFGALIVAMAVSNRGFLATLNQERRVHVRPSRLGRWAPPVMGAAFAFGWTPCIGPVLGVIIAAASTQETLGRGIVLLVAYSLGLGVPFLLAGLGLFKAFARIKPYLKQVNIVSGTLLALFGVLMLTGGLTQLSIWFSNLLSSIPWLENLTTV